jgi:hypothetical protein
MEQLPFTTLLNKYFGGTALAVLHAVHVSPGNVQAPIPNCVAMQVLAPRCKIRAVPVFPPELWRWDDDAIQI